MAANQKIRIKLKAYDHVVLDQSAEKIVEIAEKIRKEIELLRFEFDVEKRITISIGISPHCKNIDAKRWMEKADDALYYSKRNGRNQIKIYL